MSSLAIITARGGSKRIPYKNIKLFLGKPIIYYVIKAAIESKCFSEVMVSTEDRKIAMIAKKYGAKVPFFRSRKNANDYATTADVIKEVLLEYRKKGKRFTYCCCIYPTAPFITPKKLKNAYNLLLKSQADSVIPVVRFSFPIQRAFKTERGKLSILYPENLNIRSQDLIPTFHDCGQFYWLKVNNFLQRGAILTDNTIPYEFLELEVQDIDNEEDWKLAEIKYKFLKKYSKIIFKNEKI